MQKKHAVLLGIVISLILLVIATRHYPGGSQVDKNSVGYNWQHNYISNLFGERAVNGAVNGSRFWAIGGMIFLSASFALFFFEFSKRIPARKVAKIIKYNGVGGMFFTALIATPWHNEMITISSTLFLISLFYVSVFVFKSKLHWLKLLCVVCFIIFYATLYLYGSGTVKYLPIMQKINFAVTISLILALEYFARKEDLEAAQPVLASTPERAKR
jgi:hypothetical protein